MDLLMDINTGNIIINIDEDIRWQHHRIIVNFRDSGSCRRRTVPVPEIVCTINSTFRISNPVSVLLKLIL